jgi:thiol:disulfide interchange protein DsbC
MRLILLFIFSFLLSFNLQANEVEDRLLKKDGKVFKNIQTEMTEIKDLYKITFTDGQKLYYHFEDDFFTNGELFKYEEKFVNLTKFESKKFNKLIVEELESKYKSSLAYYPSKAEKTLMTIYIFSDFTCPFCKKLHSKIEDFQKSGINIYYIPFPRKSMADYGTVRGLQKIMCSKDKAAEFTKAFDNPKNYSLNVKTEDINCPEALDILLFNKYADSLEVKGTPTTLTKGGSLISGFQSPEHFAYELRKAIEEDL